MNKTKFTFITFLFIVIQIIIFIPYTSTANASEYTELQKIIETTQQFIISTPQPENYIMMKHGFWDSIKINWGVVGVRKEKISKYNDYYLLTGRFRNQALLEIGRAKQFLDNRDLEMTKKYIVMSLGSRDLSNLYNDAADDTWNGNGEKAQEALYKAGKVSNKIARFLVKVATGEYIVKLDDIKESFTKKNITSTSVKAGTYVLDTILDGVFKGKDEAIKTGILGGIHITTDIASQIFPADKTDFEVLDRGMEVMTISVDMQNKNSGKPNKDTVVAVINFLNTYADKKKIISGLIKGPIDAAIDIGDIIYDVNTIDGLMTSDIKLSKDLQDLIDKKLKEKGINGEIDSADMSILNNLSREIADHAQHKREQYKKELYNQQIQEIAPTQSPEKKSDEKQVIPPPKEKEQTIEDKKQLEAERQKQDDQRKIDEQRRAEEAAKESLKKAKTDEEQRIAEKARRKAEQARIAAEQEAQKHQQEEDLRRAQEEQRLAEEQRKAKAAAEEAKRKEQEANRSGLSFDNESITVMKGNTAEQTISVIMPSWNTDTLNFTVKDTLPVIRDGYIRNVSYDFIPKSCKISCETKLKISAEYSDVSAGSYKVTVGTWGGLNIHSSFELKIIDRIPPSAPIVRATAISASQIKLDWSDNAAQNDILNIERKVKSDSDYARLHGEPKRSLSSYVDSGLTPNARYCYRVYFTNAYYVQSPNYSQEQCATTLQNAPAIPQGKPDLVITSLRAPVMGNAGENASPQNVSITIANNGPVSAGRFVVGFYWSQDTIITLEDTRAASLMISGFGPGESRTIGKGGDVNSWGFEIPTPSSLSPGHYYLGAIIDYTKETDEYGTYKDIFVEGGQVQESNEANNTRIADTGPIELKGPPAPPTPTSPPDGFSYIYTLYDYRQPVLGKQIFEWNKSNSDDVVDGTIFNGTQCEGKITDIVINAPWDSGYIMKDMLPAGKTYSWNLVARANGVPSVPSVCHSFQVL